MNIKTVLFIDDGSITNIVEKLALRLRRVGYTLKHEKIDLKNSNFKTPNHGGEVLLDFKKIKECLKEYHFEKNYDVVACDFNFANDPLNGFDVLRWMKNDSMNDKAKVRRAKFLFYSSEEDKSIETIYNNNDISKLIRLKFDGFYGRDHLADELTSMLQKEEKTLNLSDYLLQELEKYGEFEFHNTYPALAGKKLVDIAGLIEKEQSDGIGFQKNIVDLAIAHMLDMNRIKR